MAPVALLDLDDTLIDRQAAFRRWAERFAADHDLGAEAVEVLVTADGRGYVPRPEMFEAVRRELGLAEPADELVEAYRATYLDGFEPEPDVHQALAQLRGAGWRLVVVTNGPTAMQEAKVRRAALEPLVDGVCISESVGAAKPDRRIFDEALRLAGGPPADGEVWMAGDSAPNDMAGARALGFTTVWVHRGQAWPEDGWEPDHRVPDVPAAVAVMTSA